MDALAQAGPATPFWSMRLVPCNLCGSTSFREIYPSRLESLAGRDVQEIYACTSSAYGECGPIVRCTNCGFVYQNPQPDPECIRAAYEDVVDVRYAEEREGRVHTFRRALGEIEEFARPGRLLDVGSHLGVFVEVARDLGWDARGIELSHWAVGVAQKRGLPVTRGSIADLRDAEHSYDAVTMWDVVEHLPDPTGDVRHIHRLLRPGGLLAISTMDVDAPVARVLGRRWPWYMQMHLSYFSRRTLARMVTAAGFQVVDVRRHCRIVRLGYLAEQLEQRIGPVLGRVARAVGASQLGRRLVPIDLGDIVTLFAVSVPDSNHAEKAP
ncbi:MAG TPA: class I SAM-dependent methyltransferase [Chloroflexota bacterium]|nr:class I SAM-dependent methyltransferase [Chloroflexota bacterium]